MRTLVLGLDGACMDVIKQFANDGKLPTFDKLMKEGSHGNLESVTPPLTIPAWNCLASGKNPGKIGCFSFIQKVHGSYDFKIYRSQVKREKSVWDILSDYGKEIFVFNAPNVISAYKINGYMVAGFLCPFEEKLTYPSKLRNELYSIGDEGGSEGLEFIIISDQERSRILKEMTEKHCKVISFF
ncbi:alkaline phosphatase family protein, partial [candidate division WOR-3 bacterium]|nr:alkaline phosphatase family protein [candidate division WOR-3 bacterium]